VAGPLLELLARATEITITGVVSEELSFLDIHDLNLPMYAIKMMIGQENSMIACLIENNRDVSHGLSRMKRCGTCHEAQYGEHKSRAHMYNFTFKSGF
jgi:hypothetical protein